MTSRQQQTAESVPSSEIFLKLAKYVDAVCSSFSFLSFPLSLPFILMLLFSFSSILFLVYDFCTFLLTLLLFTFE
jgi:hypothetical protein